MHNMHGVQTSYDDPILSDKITECIDLQAIISRISVYFSFTTWHIGLG